MNSDRRQQDDQQQTDVARRKFDDVTSLFGTIVPPAGTPVRPTSAKPVEPEPPPPELKVPELKTVAPPPPAAKKTGRPPELRRVDPPKARPPAPPPPRPAPAKGRTAGAAPGRPAAKKETPWPDAFVPRPNWQRKGPSRSWSWMLLVPLGIVAAIGVATLNPKMIRDVVDNALLQVQPRPAVEAPSLLPGPFRPSASTTPPAAPTTQAVESPPPAPIPAPQDARPPAQSSSQPAATSPAAQTPPAVEPEAPAATQPTAPEPVAPSASVPAPTTPAADPVIPVPPLPVPPPQPPASPVSASPAPAFSRVTITYRRGAPVSEADARRIASRLDGVAAAIDLRSTTTAGRSPTLTYYNAADKDAATALARTLAGEGAGWIVRSGPARPAGSVDIALP